MKSTEKQPSSITFEAKLVKIDSSNIVRLPQAASDKLPSRGMTMVEGTINGSPFVSPLEPDGKKSHWFKLEKSNGIKIGETLTIKINPIKDWPEPIVPNDIKKGLSNSKVAQNLWNDITPMARWDWIRWINSTKNPVTRNHRIDVMCSKLNKGNRRPCCFNRTECTDPLLSNKGILLESNQL